jgi:hypothetical protein
MDTILVKIFATALALSEVTTQPQAVKTHFDPATDQAQVVQLLRDGCAHMKQAFDIESINLDDLITTAMDDPKAAGDIQAFHGVNFSDLNTAYHQFCKNEPIVSPVVDISEVIDFYNTAAGDLPDPKVLKGKKLPSLTAVLDGSGQNFADVFQPGNRRIWVSLSDIPDYVQKAFIAAEDRRFYEHHGVDERGIIRAFIGDMGSKGRPQGGSTITQQVVKNLLVGQEVSYDRKIREMIVASRLENTLSKNEILELYMNSAYLGRGSWGVEMAAHSYFGKAAKDLTPAEGALLAGMLKGPNFYNPDRHADRAKDRLAYVLGRMQEDGVITAAQKDQALAAPPKPIAFKLPHRNSGFNFVDFVGREAKTDGVSDLTADSYTVHSTINTQLQRETETALQEGLWRYESSMGRVQFRGPEANLADAIQKKAANDTNGTPAWQQALQAAQLPLYDVHWTPVIVLQKGNGGQDGGCDPRRAARRPHRAAHRGEFTNPARPQSLRRGLCEYRREQSQRGPAHRHSDHKEFRQERGQARGATQAFDRRCHRAIARAADGRRGGACPGKQDRPDSGDGRRLLLPDEPAQSCGANRAPARLGDEAAHLSHGAAARLAAEHARARLRDHLPADRQQQQRPRSDCTRIRRHRAP